MDADIDLFVREKATGSDRPLTIPYVNYYHPTSGENIVGGGGTGKPHPLTRLLHAAVVR